MKMAMMLGVIFLSFFSKMICAAEYSAVTTSGRELTFRSSDQVMSRSSQKGAICSVDRLKVLKAKLWMTAHGHGTTPTMLVRDSEYCTSVEKMNFVMSGTWDLQVTLGDGDQAVFSFDIP